MTKDYAPPPAKELITMNSSCNEGQIYRVCLVQFTSGKSNIYVFHFREEELEKLLETKTERLSEYKTRVKELETSLESKEDKLGELQKR